jgi:hypothetical protein
VIGNGVVTNSKLNDNSISTIKIQDGAVTGSKLAPGVIPASLPPTGIAGGDLSGNYPSPVVQKLQGVAVSNTLPGNGQVLKFDGTQWAPGTDNGGAGTNPTGSAGGDLSGNYPNPNIASGAVTTPKIANGSIVTPKLADDAVNSNKLADNAVTTSKVANGAITMAKLGPDVIFGSGSPTGAAGGDLSGNYPNPSVNNGAITSTKLADNAVTTNKVVDGSITMAKLGPDVILGSGNPTGAAGGDLSGNYPNPSINNGAITSAKLADNVIGTIKIQDGAVTLNKLAAGIIPVTLPPSGTAGGDLSGNYPNPIINNGAITSSKLADDAVANNKIQDGAITINKLAGGIIPVTPFGASAPARPTRRSRPTSTASRS